LLVDALLRKGILLVDAMLRKGSILKLPPVVELFIWKKNQQSLAHSRIHFKKTYF